MKSGSVFSETTARGSRLRIGKKAALLALLAVLLAGVLTGGALAEETQRNQTALLTDDATLFEGHLYPRPRINSHSLTHPAYRWYNVRMHTAGYTCMQTRSPITALPP